MHYTAVARTALLVWLLSFVPALQAHEFWFAPIASPKAVGDSVTLRLEVGGFFIGEAAGFSIPTIQTSTANQPGCERYRRHIKTLLEVSPYPKPCMRWTQPMPRRPASA